jgi:hypothetical protein
VILHTLGFHGRNWSRPYWYLGNVWISCICGKTRQLRGAEIPAGDIDGDPDDGLMEWRKRLGITVE